MYAENSETPAKNLFHITPRKEGPTLTIRSNFDSGNAGKVESGLNSTIIITPANDCSGTEYQSHAKGWFYYGVFGAPIGYRQKFIVRKLNQLSGYIKFSDYFKPVYRYSEQNWQRIDQAVIVNRQDDTELHFQINFQKNAEIFIAYSYPFSFQDSEKALQHYKITARQNHKIIYYHQQELIQSFEGRSINLLTISSFNQKLSVRESPINQKMFLGKTNRPFKFKSEKKIVLISARVHPGQTPSSHTMHGIINFLLSTDARAQLLRRNFVFKLIPMLNPDGVYNGHYRMDTINQNLNRFYQTPCHIQQPSAFAVRNLGQYYKIQGTLAFYMDLHAHPQRKGNFIYGNSLQTRQQQIQTQLFPKILSMNCVEFDYENSCFSKNHMTLKDRNEDLTKQGCGRVVFQKVLNQIYSYTMQCGYTCSNYLNNLNTLNTPHRKIDRCKIITDDIDNIKSPYYTSAMKPYFSIRSYENLGRSICISILDLFEKNPYSRIFNSENKNLDGVKQVISEQLSKGNKQLKSYIPRTVVNQTIKNERRKGNRIGNPNISMAKTLPKTNLILQKKVFSSKLIEKEKGKDKQKFRRRTLPKIKS